MSHVKTKIWRGGVPGFNSPEASAEVSPDNTLLPPAMPGAHPEGPMLASTRILPVEELLAAVESAQGKSAQAESALVETLSKRKHTTPQAVARKRKLGKTILYGVLGVVAVIPWLFAPSAPQGAAPPPPAIPSQVARVEEQAVSTTNPLAAPLAKGKTTENPSRSTGRFTAQRAAADALAGGDYPLAIKLYEQLERDYPEDAVYGDAARILKQQHMDAR